MPQMGPLFAFAFLLCAAATACSSASSDSPDAGPGPTDATVDADAGPTSDAIAPDTSARDGSIFDSRTDDARIRPDGDLGDAACAAKSQETGKAVPANLLFLVDRSGSMNCNPPPTTASAACEAYPVKADPTKDSKWEIVRGALKQAVDSMPETNGVAITYFSSDNDCAAASTPSVLFDSATASQKLRIASTLNAVAPYGDTPIVAGSLEAYTYLRDNPRPGKVFLVLLTDGTETCWPEGQNMLVDERVPRALSLGIRTFVLGAPGSETNRAFLSDIAFQGGTARSPSCLHNRSGDPTLGDCHFDMTQPNTNFAEELKKALDIIARETIGCEFDVPKPDAGTLDYGLVNVKFVAGGGASHIIPQDPQGTCVADVEAWKYSDDKQKIILCPKACDNVKADTFATIAIELGCETQPIPPPK